MSTSSAPEPRTRRDIAAAAIDAIWQAQQSGDPLMDQQSLADEVEVVSGTTVGNALTEFGDEECERAHPGWAWVYSPYHGYRITERVDSREIKQLRGKLRASATKDRVTAAKFSARRNSLPLQQAATELIRHQLSIEMLVGQLDQVIVDEQRRERRAAMRAARAARNGQ